MEFFNQHSEINIKEEIVEIRKLISLNPSDAMSLIDALVDKAEFIKDIALRAEVFHIKGMTLHRIRKFTDANNWYHKALVLRKKAKDQRGTAITLNNIGLVYFDTDHWNKAIEYYEQALTIKRELHDYKSITATLENIGAAYQSLGDFPKASKIFYESLNISEKNQDKERMALSYMNIAINYNLMGDYEYSMEANKKSLNLNKDTGNVVHNIHILNNMGNIYQKWNKLDDAEYCYIQCLALSEKATYLKGITVAYNNLGEVYVATGKYEEALASFDKCKELAADSENQSDLAVAGLNIGHVYLNQGNLIEAEQTLHEALELSLKIDGLQQQQNCYLLLSQLYEKKNEPVKALENYKQHDAIKDKMLNVENTKIINELKERYEADKREQENEINRLKNIELKEALDIVTVEKQKSDELLRNILPEEIANEMKMNGRVKAQLYESVSVLFLDIKNFTETIAALTPHELVELLDYYYSTFDDIVTRYDIEKIKTIGDSYLCVSGLPRVITDHALILCEAACEIVKWLHTENTQRRLKNQVAFDFRLGIHSGAIIAGIVGKAKYEYDIWGDTVNTAARMEQNSEVGRINISGVTFEHIKKDFDCQYRGKIIAKNKGEIDMYFIVGKK